MKEEHNRETGSGVRLLHIFGVVLAAIALQVFFVLILEEYRGEWGIWYTVSLVGGTVLNALLLSADLIFFFKRVELAYKICVLAYFLLLFSAVVLYALLKTGFAEIAQDEERLQEYLRSSGVWMYPLFVLLQFLQVVILPIPSTVTVLAGTALFGPLNGSLLSLLGIMLGSLTAFLVGRYAGYRAVAWLVGKDTLDHWLKKIKGKDKLLLTAMFLLPVFPDDVLCFIAGLSSMSLWFFLTVIAVSRVLAVFATSYSVSLIPFTEAWGIAVWIAFGVAVVVLFVFLYKKSDAILAWFAKKFHRETRVDRGKERGDFTLEVIDPDGSIVKKGVKRREEPQKEGQDKTE